MLILATFHVLIICPQVRDILISAATALLCHFWGCSAAPWSYWRPVTGLLTSSTSSSVLKSAPEPEAEREPQIPEGLAAAWMRKAVVPEKGK